VNTVHIFYRKYLACLILVPRMIVGRTIVN